MAHLVIHSIPHSEAHSTLLVCVDLVSVSLERGRSGTCLEGACKVQFSFEFNNTTVQLITTNFTKLCSATSSMTVLLSVGCLFLALDPLSFHCVFTVLVWCALAGSLIQLHYIGMSVRSCECADVL